MLIRTVKNFQEWRNIARQLLMANVPPHQVTWTELSDKQNTLFVESEPAAKPIQTQAFKISKDFLALAELVSLHANKERWSLLYEAVWRLTHGEKYLLSISSDILVNQLLLFKKSVTRDAHKMKAFVRFRCYRDNDKEYYVAWYQPDHHVVRFVSAFFKKRFSVMNWTIMTPDETVSWNGENLIFSEGVPQKLVLEDNVEQLWCTYYRAIFNPARVKLKAMRNEMPIRYWHTMPETQFIPQLIQEAPARAGKMLRENEGLRYSAKHFFTEEMNLAALEQAAAQCKACNLYVCAKQTVFGSGSPQSKIMIIGEQPGLQEDKQGIPFVGPAGLLLREILHEIKFPLETLYFTNAVKHFKHSVISGKRIHRSPDIREVNACKPWVEKQISLINPKIIICLGNTAGRALINPGFSVTKNRGQWQEYQSRHIIGTYHPSAILRVPDVAKKIAMRQDLKNDLLMGLQKFSE